MTHTLFTLAEKSTVVLCTSHRADAIMWLWQEFEGAWTATVTGHAHCDACIRGGNVPAGLRAAVQRQQAPLPASSRWTTPKLGQVTLGQTPLGATTPGDVTLGQVRLEQVTLGHVTPGHVPLEHVAHADRTLPTLS